MVWWKQDMTLDGTPTSMAAIHSGFKILYSASLIKPVCIFSSIKIFKISFDAVPISALQIFSIFMTNILKRIIYVTCLDYFIIRGINDGTNSKKTKSPDVLYRFTLESALFPFLSNSVVWKLTFMNDFVFVCLTFYAGYTACSES